MTTVAVVDDDPEILNLVKIVCEHAGLECHSVPSGAELLSLMADKKPDLLILDIQMPDMDGFETLASVREEFPKFSGSVLFLSARKDGDTISRASDLGDTYVLKPINGHRLLEKINYVLKSMGDDDGD